MNEKAKGRLTLVSKRTRRSFRFLSTPAILTRRYGAVGCRVGSASAGTGSPYVRGSRTSGTLSEVFAPKLEVALGDEGPGAGPDVVDAPLPPHCPLADSDAEEDAPGAAASPPHAEVESSGSMMLDGE